MIPDEDTAIDPATALYAMLSWAARATDPGVRRVLLGLAIGGAGALVYEMINPEVD